MAEVRVSSQFGLPKPRVPNFVDAIPTISSTLPYWLAHGRVTPVPEIERLDGDKVVFTDGRVEAIDTIVYATGYQIKIPFLAKDAVSWIDGNPARLLGGILSPDAANLYFSGFVAPRGGGPAAMSRANDLVAKMIEVQRQLQAPLSEAVFAGQVADGNMDYFLRDWNAIVEMAHKRLVRVPPGRPC
jgi:hypothetical protein